MEVDYKKAAILLKAGYIVGFKTDTVYGLATLEKFEYKLYKLKKRPLDKKIVTMINSYLHVHDRRFNYLQFTKWPGSTTLILNQNGSLNSYRYCNNSNVNMLIDEVGSGLKVTSANYSNMPTVENDEQFREQFANIPLLTERVFESKSNTPSQILLYNKRCSKRLR